MQFRINELLKEARGLGIRVTQADLAQAAGVTQAAISRIAKGEIDRPSYNVLEAIAHTLSQALSRPISIPDLIINQRVSTQAGFDALDLSAIKQLNRADYISIPLLGEIPCGDLTQVGEGHILAVHELPKSLASKGQFLLRAIGDSMEPIISDGDLLLIEPGHNWNDNDIVIAWVSGQVTCKFLQLFDGHAALLPANLDYKPIIVSDDMHIIGRVIRSIKNFVKDWRP